MNEVDVVGTGQKFGGPWTVEKLSILSDYLNFYTTALKNQPFQLIYIDAFAGTGKINIGNEDEYEVIDGSARLAFAGKRTVCRIHLYRKEKVENTMEIFEAELPRYRDKIQMLHLCFTTDPFMQGHPEICQLSLEILQKANAAGIKCSILTKGILPAQLAELPLDNEYGITAVSLSDAFNQQFEPAAASVSDRIAALRHLSEHGCKTWVSIEPYPTPNMIAQNLHDILEAVGFADKIVFGRLHYNKIVSAYKDHKAFYNQCAAEVIEYCHNHRIAYHIKNGTITETKEAT